MNAERGSDSTTSAVIEPKPANRLVLPNFQSTPQYCIIAIGSEPVSEFWAVADLSAQKFYFDLNQNFDLTNAAEVFELKETGSILKTQNWSVTVPEIRQGEDTHTDLTFKFGKSKDDVKTVVSMKLWGWDESTTDADLIPLRLPTETANVPVIHFNGPLTMGSYRQTTKLTAGEESDFYSLIGTAGESGGTLTAITNSEIPDDAHPKAVFTFPNLESGKPAIVVSTFLKIRC